MNFNLLVLLLFFCLKSFSQTLTAKITDENRNPIAGVKVFYNNSTVSTYTDAAGIFKLPLLREIPSPVLVFYHPDFEVMVEKEYKKLQPKYYLAKKKENNSHAEGRDELFSRDAMEAAFLDNFIGTDKNAKNTLIRNKEVLTYTFDKSNFILMAKASEPLKVVNNTLGYEIEYHIEDFEIEYSGRTLDENDIDFIVNNGYAHFTDIAEDKDEQRAKSFERSVKCFFRQLVSGDKKKLKHKVSVDGYKENRKTLFEVQTIEEDLYMLKLNEEIIPHAYGKAFTEFIEFWYSKKEFTKFQIFKPYLLVDNYGNIINTADLSMLFTTNRMSNMLPINYN